MNGDKTDVEDTGVPEQTIYDYKDKIIVHKSDPSKACGDYFSSVSLVVTAKIKFIHSHSMIH